MQAEAGPGPGSAALARSEGRTLTQMRNFELERGKQERADGSAHWKQGRSHVLAAVYGPLQSTRHEGPERASVEVHIRNRAAAQGVREKAWQQLVRTTVEGVVISKLHPRCLIKVVLQILSEDGSLLACLFAAASAALIDAAIPLKTSFVASTAALLPGKQLLLDPTAIEEQEAQATLCAAFAYHLQHPSDQQPRISNFPLACTASGRASVSSHLLLLQASRLACQQIAVRVHASLAAMYCSGQSAEAAT